MYGLFDDPPRLPDRRVLVPIAPVTTHARVVDCEPLRITMLGKFQGPWLAHEEWRRSARPELYHDWMLDLHADLTEISTPDGHRVLPCDTCKTVTVTTGTTCGRCGQ